MKQKKKKKNVINLQKVNLRLIKNKVRIKKNRLQKKVLKLRKASPLNLKRLLCFPFLTTFGYLRYYYFNYYSKIQKYYLKKEPKYSEEWDVEVYPEITERDRVREEHYEIIELRQSLMSDAAEYFKTAFRNRYDDVSNIVNYGYVSITIKRNNLFFNYKNNVKKYKNKALSSGMVEKEDKEEKEKLTQKKQDHNKEKQKTVRQYIKQMIKENVDAVKEEKKKQKMKKMKVTKNTTKKNLKPFLIQLNKAYNIFRADTFKGLRYLMVYLRFDYSYEDTMFFIKFLRRNFLKKLDIDIIFNWKPAIAFNGCRSKRPRRIKGTIK